jgi:hypothetical protein
MRTLRSALSDEPLARLMAIADAWDATITATSRADVAVALSAHMLQPDAAADVRDGLPDAARDALRVFLRAGGRMPAAAAERRFGEIRPMGPGRIERERPWLAPTGPAEVLWYRGFLFRAFDHTLRMPVDALFVPSDLAALLGPAESAAVLQAAPTAPVAVASSEAEAGSPLLDDVTTLLCYVQNAEVRARGESDWDAKSRGALAVMLRDADGVQDAHPAGRFAFLANLLRRLGWVRAQDGRLRIVAQPVTHWLQQPAAERRAALARAWVQDSEWNDLAHVAGTVFEMTHTWSNHPLRERGEILRMFGAWCASCARGAVDVDEFVAHVQQSNPDFARVDGRYDTWHLRDEVTGEYLHGFENWGRVEGMLIRRVLGGPLTWLEDERLVATPAPSASVAYRVEPDAVIIVSAANSFERFQTARVADWDETRVDAFAYRLTPRSLRRAQEQGIRPARVLEFLVEKSGAPLPAAVTRAVERWADGEDVQLVRMLVLRARDAAALDALLRLDALRRAGAERLAPTVALLRAQDVRAVRALRAAIAGTGVLVEE